jgi:hypothetical protein
VANISTGSFAAPFGLAVMSHAQVMATILSTYVAIPLTPHQIRQAQRDLLAPALQGPQHRGASKSGARHAEAVAKDMIFRCLTPSWLASCGGAAGQNARRAAPKESRAPAPLEHFKPPNLPLGFGSF